MMWRKKRNRAYFMFLAGIGVLIFWLFFLNSHKTTLYQTTTITLSGRQYTVALADTPQKRAHGLSDTQKIPADGMLFIFDTPRRYSFWMKDMHYSLDFIWLDEQKQVIDIHEGISPETYPNSIQPLQSVCYVLEVPSGFIQSHGIKKGDSLSF